MNKKGLSFVTMTIILLALAVGFAVSSNINFDVDNLKENINWTHLEINIESQPDLGNAVESMIGEASFSIMKWVAQWSYENPEVPWKLLIWGFILSIATPIILVFFKLVVIIVILIKEAIQSRREKKSRRKN